MPLRFYKSTHFHLLRQRIYTMFFASSLLHMRYPWLSTYQGHISNSSLCLLSELFLDLPELYIISAPNLRDQNQPHVLIFPCVPPYAKLHHLFSFSGSPSETQPIPFHCPDTGHTSHVCSIYRIHTSDALSAPNLLPDAGKRMYNPFR